MKNIFKLMMVFSCALFVGCTQFQTTEKAGNNNEYLDYDLKADEVYTEETQANINNNSIEVQEAMNMVYDATNLNREAINLIHDEEVNPIINKDKYYEFDPYDTRKNSFLEMVYLLDKDTHEIYEFYTQDDIIKIR